MNYNKQKELSWKGTKAFFDINESFSVLKSNTTVLGMKFELVFSCVNTFLKHVQYISPSGSTLHTICALTCP